MTTTVQTGSMTNLDSVRALILPHIKAVTGTEYMKKESVHDKIFEWKDTKMFYDEMVEVAPLGVFQEVSEAEEVRGDALKQHFKTKATQRDFATVHRITHRAMKYTQDKQQLALDASKHLMRAAFHTLENLATLVLDNSRDSTYAGGDGKELVATDHPLVDGTNTCSNELATPKTFSQAGIHELLILQRQMVDPRGNPMAVRGDKLVVPTDLYIEAQEVLKTIYQVGTANNTANVIVQNKLLPGGIINLDYSTNSTAYYILANRQDVENGLLALRSSDLEITSDVNNPTRTINIYAFFSNVFFWHDFRQIVGTAGA